MLFYVLEFVKILHLVKKTRTIFKIYLTFTEVTSIRSGLRKRKRPESPQSTDPQVTEEWVDEDKLELWEIKQYGERCVSFDLAIFLQQLICLFFFNLIIVMI